jgi:hypothetical protein
MPTPFSVVHILADDSPVLKFEDLFSKNIVGLEESIEDEPGNLLAIDI